ncbi:hypothetical protein DXG01_005397 [Tephrocybe rancida]|nr:hypothetical protein DXG01_005397 [Tephrocybe rancida]
MTPYFSESALFAENLPDNTSSASLRDLLKDFLVLRITLDYGMQAECNKSTSDNWRRAPSGPKRPRIARIDFQDIAEAEKAYAIVNTRCIPGPRPDAPLFLSTSLVSSRNLVPRGYPRFVKLLPPTITDIELYTKVRPYGSLASVRVDPRNGCIVQFWTEDDAKIAADQLKAAFSRSTRYTLQAYDPCRVYCRVSLDAATLGLPLIDLQNLNHDVNNALLKDLLSQCGTVTSVEMPLQTNGKMKGLGVVSFQTPEGGVIILSRFGDSKSANSIRIKASNAIQRYNGAAWRSKTLIVRYHEVVEALKPLATPEIHVPSDPVPSDPVPADPFPSNLPPPVSAHGFVHQLWLNIQQSPPPPAPSDTVKDAIGQDEPSIIGVSPSSSQSFDGQQLIIDALLEKMKSMSEEGASQKALYETTIIGLKERVETLQGERELLNAVSSAENDALKKRAATSEAEAEAYRASVTELQKRLDTREASGTSVEEIIMIRKENETLQSQLEQTEREFDKWRHTANEDVHRASARSFEKEKEVLEGLLRAVEIERDDWRKKLDDITTAKADMEDRFKFESDKLNARFDDIYRERSVMEGRLEQIELDHQARLRAWAENEASNRSELAEVMERLHGAEKDKHALDIQLTQAKLDHGEKQVAWEKQEAHYKLELSEATTRLDVIANENADLAAQLKRANLNRDGWRHRFEVLDSRRKISEMEADRPLWEEAKRVREAKEREAADLARREAEVKEAARKMREMHEAEKRRKAEEEVAKQEALRKAQEAESQRQQREAYLAQEKRRRELEEAEKLAKENARQKAWTKATNDQLTRCYNRDKLLCAGPWDFDAALERFLEIIDDFERTKFFEVYPLTFTDIPWPILDNPLSSVFGPELVTWERVENFFSHTKGACDADVYKKLVERVHRMFHPDKWRSRAILESMQNQDLRTATRSAGNVVAQAITPIWKQTRSQ